ncbi:Eco57I restriction-modification methylase domain-containing protein [Bradyrhizobium sp. USDA 241]|uniref:Eco57I restriction-modification methylase domain-containing protein n=1 Tax=Bradyrhizobium sp. USDA 241 TaxID=3377725 RepID=UPI003C75CD01
MSAPERELAALAASFIGKTAKLTAAERKLIARVPKISRTKIAETRAAIKAGGDPLGDLFCQLRSPELRRDMGAVYTPAPIVDAMLAWASIAHVTPDRVVDPGAGSGRFLIAAAHCFPMAELIAVEVDPLAALLLRANAAVLGFANRLSIQLTDYRALELPAIDGATLFIGNPPYVRHHDITDEWKTWFAATAARLKFTASKLAGLHMHFFLKTRELAKPGDFGAFITAAEWLDVNYGSLLRKMLADGLGGSAIHIIKPTAQPFENALTTGAITCFHVGNRPNTLSMREVNSLAELSPLAAGREVAWSDIAHARKWSVFVREQSPVQPGFVELGELFRVHRGQVTGSNATWIENEMMAGIPDRYLRPSITRARELIAAGSALRDASRLRRVLDLPVDLDELAPAELDAVKRFLRWAKERQIDTGYIAASRKAWWAVQLREPPPIFSTYMARSAPSFVTNLAQARYINIAHGLYPREPMTSGQLEAVVSHLRRYVTTEGGRIYAGGLVKFEPRELERLRIPALDRLHEYTADSVEAAGTAGRRKNGARSVPK